MNTRSAALLIGFIFLAVGAAGYVSNPLIGSSDEAIFHSDSTHNLVHIASGLLFLLMGFFMPVSAAGFMMLFGVMYFGLGIWGLLRFGTDEMGELLGFLQVNSADNFLHIGLGAIIFLLGAALPRSAPA